MKFRIRGGTLPIFLQSLPGALSVTESVPPMLPVVHRRWGLALIGTLSRIACSLGEEFLRRLNGSDGREFTQLVAQ